MYVKEVDTAIITRGNIFLIQSSIMSKHQLSFSNKFTLIPAGILFTRQNVTDSSRSRTNVISIIII
jgi:hypothetical protein